MFKIAINILKIHFNIIHAYVRLIKDLMMMIINNKSAIV